MGLAASQCRLLFITQRQNDVSAKMQKISMDRMCLARDEDDIETKYNRMLNATKYEAADGVNLSYDALMASGKVLSDNNGAIILNSATYNELKTNGYITNNEQSGTLNLGDKTEFIKKMAGLTDAQVNAPSFEDFVTTHATEYPLLAANPTRPAETSSTEDITKTQAEVIGSHSGFEHSGYIEKRSESDVINECKDILAASIGMFVSDLAAKAKAAFSDYPALNAKVVAAASAAESATKSASTYLGNATSDGTAGAEKKCNGKAGYATATWTSWEGLWFSVEGQGAYDRCATAARFFTEFAKALGGSPSDSSVTFKDVKIDNSEDLKAWDAEYKIAQTAWKQSLKDAGIDDSTAQKKAKYEALYDNLNGKNFVLKDLDADAIANGIANGTIFVNGSFAKDMVTEVADEETRANAEHWYDVETKKIKRKEDAMDMENTKLQTEYQSLTSDMQSVQNIINQNIQKSFTYCSQG